MSIITQVSFQEQLRAHSDLDKQSIAELKEWNLQQTHLPKLDDADLALFYLNNSYDVEATKRNVNNYFLMRHHMPEYFVVREDLQSSELKMVFDSVFIVTLPQRTKDNHKIILARLMHNEPARYNFESAVKVMNMVMDAGIYEDGPDNKYVFVFDLNGATMEHRNTLSWIGLKKFYEYVRKGSPIEWFGAHYTNTGTGNTDFQEFVKSRIVEGNFADSSMVRLYSDMDTLMEGTGMERSMLPKEMGGKAGPAVELQRQQVKKLESLHAFFVNLERKVKLANTENIPSALEIFGPEKAL